MDAKLWRNVRSTDAKFWRNVRSTDAKLWRTIQSTDAKLWRTVRGTDAKLWRTVRGTDALLKTPTPAGFLQRFLRTFDVKETNLDLCAIFSEMFTHFIIESKIARPYLFDHLNRNISAILFELQTRFFFGHY